MVSTLRDFMQGVADTLSDSLVVDAKYGKVGEDEDAFFEEVCREELLGALQSDLDHFFFLLCDDRFGEEEIVIESELAEPILRATSALRMQIKRLFLKDILDSDLEMGTVDYPMLPVPSQKAYICYVFLATLQETLLYALEPSLELETE